MTPLTYRPFYGPYPFEEKRESSLSIHYRFATNLLKRNENYIKDISVAEVHIYVADD